MKVRFAAAANLEFEVEGSTQKEIFSQLASISEIFSHEACGVCKSEATTFIVRTVDENDFFERKCLGCGAKLAYGQHKTSGSLFPKRKKELEDGTEVFDRESYGWFKWVPNPDAAPKEPKKKGKR